MSPLSANSISGKDAPLAETIDRASSLLERLGIEVKASGHLNPTPGCWSVHLRCTTCPALYTNGKGTSREACLASGLGEFMERLSTDFFFAEYCTQGTANPPDSSSFHFHPGEIWFAAIEDQPISASIGSDSPLLTPELLDYYNPESELLGGHLVDNNLDWPDRGIATLPFTNLASGENIYFPLSLLNNLYVSNGMAAGNSMAEASAQALSEILERFVKKAVITAGISLPDVPRTTLARYPHLQKITQSLETAGFAIRVKDASLGGHYPVICAILIDTTSGGVFASFGCNLRFETAIERTLTELLQGRQLQQLHDFQRPVNDMNRVADPYNLESHFIDSDGLLSWRMLKEKADYPFCGWDFKGSTADELKRLTAIITTEGYHIYRAQYQHIGMYSCRLLVPGMSEIYPVDDLVWNNRNRGAIIRPSLLVLGSMDRAQLTTFLEQLDDLDFADELLVSYLTGILFDQESAWASLRIGELKTLILLALKRHRQSMEWCIWCIEYGGLSGQRKDLYQLLHTLLGFKEAGEDLEEYSESLHLLYTEQQLSYAHRIIAAELTFPGLTFAGSWAEISTSHSRLLEIYDLLHGAKRRWGSAS